MKSKLLVMSLAASLMLAMTPAAHAGYGFPVFKFPIYKIHFPKHKLHHPKIKVKSGGGHHHHHGFGKAVVWSIIGCAGGVVLAALAANYRDHRELTADEAASCGVLFLFSQPGVTP